MLRRGSSGVTLVELMVTVALMAILATLSIPSFVTWIRNGQIRSVADSLQTGLRVAQAEALRRNRQVVLAFTNDTPAATGVNPYANATAVARGKRWWAQTVPQTGETAADIQYVTAGVIVDGASAVTVTSSPSANALCFGSVGRLVSNASITGLSSATCTAQQTWFDVNQPSGADRPLRVIVQLGGQVRMCDPGRPTLSSTSPDGCPP